MSKIPSDDVFESLYKLRIRESAQLKSVLELYDMHGDSSEDIDAQLSKIEGNGLRLRNFDARNEKIETGAVVTSRRRSSGVEGGKGVFVTSGKQKVGV